jgi:hypothetical protein
VSRSLMVGSAHVQYEAGPGRTPGSSASHQKAYFTENCPRFRLPLSPLTTVRLL